MRREFIVRVRYFTRSLVPTLYTIMQISMIYLCIEMCKYTKIMKMKNNLMCIVCHSRVAYVFIGNE